MTDTQQPSASAFESAPPVNSIGIDLAVSHLRQPAFLSPAPVSSDQSSNSSTNSFNGSIPNHVAFHPDNDSPRQQPTAAPTPQVFHSHNNGDLIDHSNQHVAEGVVELSPERRYGRLNTLLGKGAFKVVHKAIDREEGYEVAWNVIQIGDKNTKNIQHEIEILKSVRHPNIIAFHDAWIGVSKTEFVFITELMTSGTLREYIRKLNLPNLKIVKRWCRQILKGLDYLHNLNPRIIHRDIKCDNIFINGAHNEIKIGDMGTAENMWLDNKKYTLIGTPEFMAPEMYEERGYSEKVDIYAFGMCLLEMVTGDYPYAECTNAAQVFKKVSQHIKPESLSKVPNQQVLDVINGCLADDENQRPSAQELLECSFLAVEPDVQLLSIDPSHKHLTLQVVFKGSDKVSVKFSFNVETDTAEDVVAEMIEEQVLSDRYQHWITTELNRILRDIDSVAADGRDNRAIWQRDHASVKELKEIKEELNRIADLAREAERRRDDYEQQLAQAEERQRDVERELERCRARSCSSSSSDTEMTDAYKDVASSPLQKPPSDTEAPTDESIVALMNHVYPEFSDDTSIDDFVRETAIVTNRNEEKAVEWAAKLKDQDIMTVGDLRELLDEDWASIGLTVFALRALKNMLRQNEKSPVVEN